MGRYSKALINAPLIPITWLTTSLFGQAPTPTAPTNFQHVVVIFQENRTPDNLFQGLCSPPYGTADSCSTTPGPGQYNIQTADWLDKTSPTGKTSPVTIPLANAYDLSHAHSAFVAQCDLQSNGTCAMDGAAKVACSGTCPTQPQFRYVENAGGILNPYLNLATHYGWANNMFQTNQAPVSRRTSSSSEARPRPVPRMIRPVSMPRRTCREPLQLPVAPPMPPPA